MQDLVATAFQRAADEHFVVAHAVEVAGVDQVHAAIDRGMDRGDALVLVRVPVHAGHAHASQRNGKHLRAVCAEAAGGDGFCRHDFLRPYSRATRLPSGASISASRRFEIGSWQGPRCDLSGLDTAGRPETTLVRLSTNL